MENGIISLEEARSRGFTISREEALSQTGWSNATLGRKMKAGAVEFVRTAGKTSLTPLFNQTIFKAAGISIGFAETEKVSEIANFVTPEQRKQAQKNLTTISEPSQENLALEKIASQPNFRTIIEETLLLPFERILNLKQAATESGLSRAVILSAIASGEIKARRFNPQRRVRGGKEFVTGRMQISFISLKKFTAGYLN